VWAILSGEGVSGGGGASVTAASNFSGMLGFRRCKSP